LEDDNQGIHISEIGGDVIGVGISGSGGNIIGKDITLGSGTVININNRQFEKIPDEYAKALKDFCIEINQQIKKPMMMHHRQKLNQFNRA
jgi:hypothetical protein